MRHFIAIDRAPIIAKKRALANEDIILNGCPIINQDTILQRHIVPYAHLVLNKAMGTDIVSATYNGPQKHTQNCQMLVFSPTLPL